MMSLLAAASLWNSDHHPLPCMQNGLSFILSPCYSLALIKTSRPPSLLEAYISPSSLPFNQGSNLSCPDPLAWHPITFLISFPIENTLHVFKINYENTPKQRAG